MVFEIDYIIDLDGLWTHRTLQLECTIGKTDISELYRLAEKHTKKQCDKHCWTYIMINSITYKPALENKDILI